MTLPPPEQLRGMPVRDRDGLMVGAVGDLFVHRATGEVRYLGVGGGGPGQVLVPLARVTAHDNGLDAWLRLPYTEAQLRAAPELPPGQEATVSLEGEIHSHFAGTPYWDAVRARQTTPAPTPELAAADAAAARAGASDATVYDARRTDPAARQTPPAPTTRIADAEMEDALARGDDPSTVRLRRWGT
jgi:hypothetical protein